MRRLILALLALLGVGLATLAEAQTQAPDEGALGAGVRVQGVFTAGDCIKSAAPRTLADAGAACGSGGGGTNPISGYTSGDWYGPWPGNYNSGNTYQEPLNDMFCVPLSVYQSVHVNSLSVDVSGAGSSSNIQLGLYGSTSAGLPGSLIGNTSSIVTTGTGVKTGTFTSTAITAGQYWLCAETDTTSATFDAITTTNGYTTGAAPLLGSSSAANYFSVNNGGWSGIIYFAAGFGTWASSLSGQSWTYSATIPHIAWHVASIP